jgi:hypothetical protein
MSSIPKDLDQTDTAAVRAYILQWHNANRVKPAPRDWYRSWELYLDRLRNCHAEPTPGVRSDPGTVVFSPGTTNEWHL